MCICHNGSLRQFKNAKRSKFNLPLFGLKIFVDYFSTVQNFVTLHKINRHFSTHTPPTFFIIFSLLSPIFGNNIQFTPILTTCFTFFYITLSFLQIAFRMLFLTQKTVFKRKKQPQRFTVAAAFAKGIFNVKIRLLFLPRPPFR